MRDFSHLHGSRTTVEAKKWVPLDDSPCHSCGCMWRLHRHEPTDTACRTCTCDEFVIDSSVTPDEVHRIVQWHYADNGEVITDPDEIAELERRLALIGGA